MSVQCNKNELNKSYKDAQTGPDAGEEGEVPVFPGKEYAQVIFRFTSISTISGDHPYYWKADTGIKLKFYFSRKRSICTKIKFKIFKKELSHFNSIIHGLKGQGLHKNI